MIETGLLKHLFDKFKFPPKVNRWIRSAEEMLTAGFSIPGSLADAESLKKEHEHFQTAIEKTHARYGQ